MNKMYHSLFCLVLTFGSLTFQMIAHSQLFEDHASDLQIQHSMNNIDFWGAGVSVFDIDNDGWDDITFIQENDSIVIYKNNSGTFELMQPFILNQGRTKSQIWVDYDNDGDNDLVVSTYNGPLRLYRNNGDFSFIEVPFELSLSEINSANYGVTFADFDRDGFLDMYLCRYVFSGNPNNEGLTNLLFRNNGDGTFSNVTSTAGVGNGIGLSFMGVWMDVNKDLWPDLYIINDRLVSNNALYRNNGDGTFTDLTAISGTALPGDDPMSATFADFDNDGDLDHYSSNTGDEGKLGRLLVHDQGWLFNELGEQYGVAIDKLSWGSTWIDVDNDSYLDLYVSTGTAGGSFQEERSYLYMNQQGTSFIDSPSLFSGNHVAASFAVAKGDLNNDGFGDLVVQNINGTNSFVWINQSELNGSNNYVKVELEGVVSNKMAIGAWIKVYCENDRYVHYTRCGENYLSQNSQHLIFGLSNHQIIDSLVIEFPSGIIDRYYNLSVNTDYKFIEGGNPINTIQYSGDLKFCDQVATTLDAGEYDQYLWNTGHQGRYLTVNAPGSYWVVVQNSFGLSIPSDTILVELGFTPDFQAQIQHVDCNGESNGSILLESASQVLNNQIIWSDGSSGLLNNSLSPGLYSYNYTDVYGCSFEDSAFIFEPDPLYLFSQSNFSNLTQLFSLQLQAVGGTPGYSYFIDGQETSNFIIDLEEGNYEVEVMDVNGCSSTEIISLSTVGLSELEAFSSLIYPNPNTDGLFYFPTNIELLSVHDISGKKIPFHADFNQGIIQLSEDASGLYFAVIKRAGDLAVVKLVVN